MAFTRKDIPYGIQNYFMYYASGLNASMEENLTPTFDYVVEKVRLHLSVVHASVVDFIIRLSAAQGSAYDQSGIVSVAMNALAEYIYVPSVPLRFEADDSLNFSMTMSADNRYGLTIYGWAVTGP